MKRTNVFALTVVGGLLASSLAVGETVVTPSISGNELTAKIQLGGIEADLTITFEQVVGLNPSALSLSATLLDPSDPALLARLPEGGAVSVPVSFPVLVRIEPTASSALSFSGVYRISLYTHNLTLGTGLPLRLFKAPQPSGAFEDITGFLELGSVRAGGGPGSMSDFLIVADARPVDTIIVAKLDALQAALTAHAGSMPPAVFSDLQNRLNNARGLYQAGSLAAAINAVAGFGEEVKRQSGSAIPDVYRANSPLVNVAGLLRCAADTLKFSLTVKSNQPPMP